MVAFPRRSRDCTEQSGAETPAPPDPYSIDADGYIADRETGLVLHPQGTGAGAAVLVE